MNMSAILRNVEVSMSEQTETKPTLPKAVENFCSNVHAQTSQTVDTLRHRAEVLRQKAAELEQMAEHLENYAPGLLRDIEDFVRQEIEARNVSTSLSLIRVKNPVENRDDVLSSSAPGA